MRRAIPVSGATSVGTRISLAMLLALLLACSGAPPGPADPTVARAEPPSSEERYCAWFGDVRDGVLYFGQAAFWSAYRASAESGGGRARP